MKYSFFNSTHMTKQEKNSNQCQRQCIAKDLVIIQLQTSLGTCIFPVISTHKTGKGSQKLLSQRPGGMLAVRSRPLLTPPFLVVGFVASHPPFPTVGLLHFSSSSIQRQPPPQRHHHGRRQGQAGAKAQAHGGEAAAQHLPQEHVRPD